MRRRAWISAAALLLADACGDDDPTVSGSATTSGPQPSTTGVSTTELPTTDIPTTTNDGTTLDPTNSSQSGGDGPHLDPMALMNFYNGCVTPGVKVDELVANGVLAGGDGSPWTCALVPGPGNGSLDFDHDPNTPDTFPPGLQLDPSNCEHYGPLDLPAPYGAHGWITTYTQSGADVLVPGCFPAYGRTPDSYEVLRQDAGASNTEYPLTRLFSPDHPFSFGTDQPDPKFTAYGGPCTGDCYYNIVHTNNALDPATIRLDPQMQYPADSFEGFTHALRIDESDLAVLQQYAGRAWVMNVNFEYCIAADPHTCGNDEPDPAASAALVRANGGGTTIHFTLVLVPFY